MQYKRITQALPILMMMLAGSAAIAGAANDVIVARQAHYKDLGKAFKAINDQLKLSAPDLAVIKANASIVTKLGQQQKRENWFPANTGAGQGLQTAANGAIWKNIADFNAKRSDFANASARYAGTAAKGNLDAIKAATANVGKTCKGCHENFRDQDKS